MIAANDDAIVSSRLIAGSQAIGHLEVLLEFGYIPPHHAPEAQRIINDFWGKKEQS